MYIFEDEWLCMDMDIKSRLLLKRIRRNHMFHENIRRNPRGFSAVGSMVKCAIQKKTDIVLHKLDGQMHEMRHTYHP